MSALAAAAAVGAALAAGAPPAWLAVVAVCWGLTLVVGDIAEVLLLLMAPVVLAIATPVDAAVSWRLVAAAAAVSLAVVPLFRGLGPGRPSPRAAAVVLAAFATPIALRFTPPGALLSSSDLATGAAVLALAAGLIVAASASTLRWSRSS